LKPKYEIRVALEGNFGDDSMEDEKKKDSICWICGNRVPSEETICTQCGNVFRKPGDRED